MIQTNAGNKELETQWVVIAGSISRELRTDPVFSVLRGTMTFIPEELSPTAQPLGFHVRPLSASARGD